MNANRMKYSSTPTYGMQKRGLFKKSAAQKAPEAPDFSQAPEPLNPIAQQPLFTTPTQQPQQAFGNAPFVPSSNPFPPSPYFQNMQGASPVQPTSPFPLMTPNFIQPSAQLPQQGAMPMQTGSMGQPIGNSAPPINAPGGNYTTRLQGYVPPTTQQPQQQPVQPQMLGQTAQRPSVQPAAYAGMNPMFGGMPQPMQQGIQQPMYQGMPQQAPVFQQMPQMQMPSGQQPPMFNVRTPAQPRQKEPMDANRLWTIFLFGVLPLLFIPCLFIPSSLNFIRYLFLALCVCGLGGMWYRQMFTSSTRLIVSIAYVALCIVAIAMMMQGNRDITTGAASQPVSAQESIAPDGSGNAMVAAPTATEPVDTPTPMESGPSEAEQRLTTFMTLWSGNNTPEMVSYVQPSWASVQDNPSSQLFIVLANRTPEEFTIEDISGTDEDSSRTVTMTAVINKNNGKDPVTYRFMVLMVKEGGEWYVNPNSLATNDEVESSEENVVNNANSVELATEAPRTTVTPVPPADTKLYYNPSGGSFYHADPNCDSVNSEYLPLAGSFLYSDLGDHSDLQPCLKCGAPTQALE